ncbi:unnamed protein product [Rotaria sordida]|uniref:Uncharacterized protein n=1 Tax=Rotaria sordida TaxID=392033 RepID=A0A815G628_9BILA|nr:unnamed protein product [Rotaria sordida]CAF1593448.1 unnamed protein product [Rotaria sordida]
MDLCEVTFQSKSGQQQTGLFHRTTKWQQINFWLKNLASMIEKPAENYAYWDQKHHSIVDGNQSISSTIHPSMTTTFDEIKWNDTIEVTFSLDNNNQTRLSDSILVEVDDQENIISQQFTIFATMANVYQQNKINTEQQSLLYFNDVIPSLDTQLISFPLKSTIEFTLIDAKLPITATIVNVEDQCSIKFQCSYFIIIKHLCQIACQLFVVNSDYYRLLFQNNVLDGDDMSLDAIDCSMIEMDLHLICTATLKCSIKYCDQTLMLPSSENTLISTILEETFHKFSIPQADLHLYELIVMDNYRTKTELNNSIEEIIRLLPDGTTLIQFELQRVRI